MNMTISNARLATMIKQVAKNIAPISKRKQKLVELMAEAEAKAKTALEKQLAKYKAEYDSLTEQQELFEAPIRNYTGGYGTEDLITSELVETGVDKNGKPNRITRYTLKYPDTIVPPETTDANAAQEAGMAEAAPQVETQSAPFEGVAAEDIPGESTGEEAEVPDESGDLPFKD